MEMGNSSDIGIEETLEEDGSTSQSYIMHPNKVRKKPGEGSHKRRKDREMDGLTELKRKPVSRDD